MELGDEPEVKTAAKLAQMMAYQNKNMLQARPPPACAVTVADQGCRGVFWHGPACLPCLACSCAALLLPATAPLPKQASRPDYIWRSEAGAA